VSLVDQKKKAVCSCVVNDKVCIISLDYDGT